MKYPGTPNRCQHDEENFFAAWSLVVALIALSLIVTLFALREDMIWLIADRAMLAESFFT
jgi:hypothetical protein